MYKTIIFERQKKSDIMFNAQVDHSRKPFLCPYLLVHYPTFLFLPLTYHTALAVREPVEFRWTTDGRWSKLSLLTIGLREWK